MKVWVTEHHVCNDPIHTRLGTHTRMLTYRRGGGEGAWTATQVDGREDFLYVLQ